MEIVLLNTFCTKERIREKVLNPFYNLHIDKRCKTVERERYAWLNLNIHTDLFILSTNLLFSVAEGTI